MKKLKVVNMCSNPILFQGITKLLISCEEIIYDSGALHTKEVYLKAKQADVVIVEDTHLADPTIHALLGKGHGTIIYISLDGNEITLVTRQQFCLGNVQDLYKVIKGSARRIVSNVPESDTANAEQGGDVIPFLELS